MRSRPGRIVFAYEWMRTERMPELREEAAEEHEAKLAVGAPSSYDPNRPWNTVWKLAVNDNFWSEFYEQKAVLILAKVKGAKDYIDDDSGSTSLMLR